MSAPALTPRPVTAKPDRPTRPVQRKPPARVPQARTGASRAVARAASRAGSGAGSSARSTARPVTDRSARPDRSGRGVVGATAGATALSLPNSLPGTGPSPSTRTRMRVLERPQTGSRRVGFAVTCTAMLGALMLGLLLLNVAISGNAFTTAELQSERSLLVDQQQSLEQQLLVHGSPSALSARARALGMVPAPQVIVLAPDGTGAPPVAPAP